jgi:hypothetical protein
VAGPARAAHRWRSCCTSPSRAAGAATWPAGAATLRQRGLTLVEIGRRLGITKQAVHQLLDEEAT